LDQTSGILRSDVTNLNNSLDQSRSDINDIQNYSIELSGVLRSDIEALDQKIDNTTGSGTVTYEQASNLAKKWAIILG
jgi:hypothetical protein